MNKNKISYTYITDFSSLSREAEHLLNEKSIAVDLESDSLFHYTEKVCLMQISTAKKNLLVDPLAIKNLSPLETVFSNRSIRKILHGSDYDIRSLHRDFGIEVSSLFDTQLAARILGAAETGLASLLKEHFNVELEKKYQKKDWSRRPLPDDMLVYGVYDTCYLIPLGRILERRLIEKGRYSLFEEECELLTRVRFAPASEDPLFMKFKGINKFTPRELAILEAVLNIRENIAMEKDRPPFKVLSNDQILNIVREKPKTLNGLKKLTEGQRKKMGRAILGGIGAALKIPETELPRYPKPESKSVEHDYNRNIKLLKKWRNEAAEKFDLEPPLLCTNAQIQLLFQASPENVSRLRKLGILKKWQIKLCGREICRLFREISPSSR